MECVETTQEIGTYCNITLLTSKELSSNLFDNPTTKRTGWVSSVTVIFWCQVTYMIVEEKFKGYCMWIKLPSGLIEFYSNDPCIYNDFPQYPLCWSSSIWNTYVLPSLFFHRAMSMHFPLKIVVNKNIFYCNL